MDKSVLSFGLPGFRFKPTEEELINFYLKNIVYDKKLHIDIIGFLDIYQYDPWDLPGLARIGEREWYFVVPRDRKHFNGCGRPRRTTEYGFWKATGSDRKIVSMSEPKRVIGFRKTLVYYKGRAPRGSKTDWIMNEYRLPDNCALHKEAVLCKVYRKATSLRELEERASKEEANEEHTTQQHPTSPSVSFSNSTTSINNGVDHQEDFSPTTFMSTSDHTLTLKREVNEGIVSSNTNTIQLPFAREALGTLQVPKSGFDLVHDPLLSQSCSPWLENLLNFSSPTLAQFVL